MRVIVSQVKEESNDSPSLSAIDARSGHFWLIPFSLTLDHESLHIPSFSQNLFFLETEHSRDLISCWSKEGFFITDTLSTLKEFDWVERVHSFAREKMILFVEEEHRDALPDKEIRFKKGGGFPQRNWRKCSKVWRQRSIN